MTILTTETLGGVSKRKYLKIENLAAMSEARKRKLLLRSVTRMEGARPLVQGIMAAVQRRGDKALLEYTREFDKVKLKPASICVSKAEIREAYKKVRAEYPDLLAAMKTTRRCVRDYHEGEKDQLKLFKKWNKKVKVADSRSGINVGQLRAPIGRVGVYVPGGRKALFSTAIMAITPATVAGVPEIVVASPPSRDGDIDPKIIVAADLAGATLIVRAGGAQAIAAMAYGTESVPKVSKIFGPGNIYVAAAKGYVASNGICAIDFLAGPSEILIVADDSADAEWVARDMISQAEHDPDACAILVTNSKDVALSVQKQISEIINVSMTKGEEERLSAEIAVASLTKFGAIVTVNDLEEAITFANEFAPEHLQMMTNCPRNWVNKVRNAGAIFVGHYSPVAIGDYVCPNHILPTGGAAKYTSGINIDMFMKKPAFSQVPTELLGTLNNLVGTLSRAEGLYNQHGLSVEARMRRRKPVRRQ